MGAMTGSPDAVVVGGGVIGLGVAWRAARLGVRITLVDPEPGRGASWAAAGMLAPVTEAHPGEEALLALGLASAALYPGFVAELEAETGLPVGYRRCGTLAVGLDADDVRALDDLAGLRRRLGLDAERLNGRECRDLEPMLAPGVRGGVHAASDHQVDNRRLVAALTRVVDRSCEVVRQRVSEVIVGRGRAEGVRLESGAVVSGAAVVIAAGCRSGEVPGIPAAVRPPVRPVKGQILRLRVPAGPPLLTRTVRWLAHGQSGYLVPRDDGELVLGATQEERGFDAQVTAGAVLELLRDAYSIVPGVAEAALEECRAGLRPGSPDNAPLLGPTRVDGLLMATGHHRNGVLLTPITARSIAGLLATGEVDPAIAAFAPDRFVTAGAAA
jgi:glycine oxidase